MATFVGIDLGTTNSVVAHRNAYGRPEVIPNREGQNITPSVVYFGTTPPAVGQEAKEWARLGNDEIASFFKPHMGSPLYQLRFHGRDYSARLEQAGFNVTVEDYAKRLSPRQIAQCALGSDLDIFVCSKVKSSGTQHLQGSGPAAPIRER